MDYVTPLDRFVPMKEASDITAKPRSSLYAILADPKSDFPRPFKVGRRTYFLRSELEAWMNSRPRAFSHD